MLPATSTLSWAIPNTRASSGRNYVHALKSGQLQAAFPGAATPRINPEVTIGIKPESESLPRQPRESGDDASHSGAQQRAQQAEALSAGQIHQRDHDQDR